MTSISEQREQPPLQFSKEFVLKVTNGHFMFCGLSCSIVCSYEEGNLSETFVLTFKLMEYLYGSIEEEKVFNYTFSDIRLLTQCALTTEGDPVLTNNRVFSNEINNLIDSMNDSPYGINISDFDETHDKWVIGILGAIYSENRNDYCKFVKKLKVLQSSNLTG